MHPSLHLCFSPPLPFFICLSSTTVWARIQVVTVALFLLRLIKHALPSPPRSRVVFFPLLVRPFPLLNKDFMRVVGHFSPPLPPLPPISCSNSFTLLRFDFFFNFLFPAFVLFLLFFPVFLLFSFLFLFFFNFNLILKLLFLKN